MRLLIVDDHVMFREGMASLLSAESDIKIVGQAGTLQQAIRMAHDLQPEVILMDYGLPDGNGIDAISAILAERPDTKIVLLTINDSDDRLFSALRSGAKGYLLKNLPVASLIDYLHAVEKNEVALTPELAQTVFKEFARPVAARSPDQSKLGLLTFRELDILKELASYASNDEIAARFSLSSTTVKNHVHSILKKLDLKNRREAARFALEQGLGEAI
jgi:NarL family two-component system response regulator LiaR